MVQKQNLVTPKVCLTASGCLIHDGRVLLIKHKKTAMWLKPGGHIEPEELPHKAAEREFFEETGIMVRAVKYGLFPAKVAKPKGAKTPPELTWDNEFTPVPFAANLHWVSHENYHASLAGRINTSVWTRGCEQHLNFDYLVEPTSGVNFTDASDEIHDIGWFLLDEIDNLWTSDDVKYEVKYAFRLAEEYQTGKRGSIREKTINHQPSTRNSRLARRRRGSTD